MNDHSNIDLPDSTVEDFVQIARQANALWGLKGGEGWVLITSDKDTCLPLWSSESLAQAWLEGSDSEAQAVPIDYDQWVSTWLPGMYNNGTLVLLNPRRRDLDNVMIDAGDLTAFINGQV